MSAEAIRNIVDRCYATPTGILMPNSLDQLNPFVPNTSSEGPQQPHVDPGDVVRNLVGRCYSDPIPNKPNPLAPVNPPPTGPPPETPDPPPTPPEIIRRLVERCYPDPPVITIVDILISPPEIETFIFTPVPLPVNDFKNILLLLAKAYPSPALITS